MRIIRKCQHYFGFFMNSGIELIKKIDQKIKKELQVFSYLLRYVHLYVDLQNHLSLHLCSSVIRASAKTTTSKPKNFSV